MASPARGARRARPTCGGVRRCRELLLAFDDQQGDGLRCASQAGPGNDINAGSPGSQKAPTRSPASPGAIRPGSTLIEEVRFATVSPPEGDGSNPRSPSTVSSLHAGGRDTTHGANDRICHQGRTPNCGGRRDSLITAETSLIARRRLSRSRRCGPCGTGRSPHGKRLAQAASCPGAPQTVSST
jgi:hypothetical protein